MDLTDIETRADELADELSTTTSKGQAEMLAWQVRGLADLAQIKATAAHQKRMAEQVPMQLGSGSIIPYAAPPAGFSVVGLADDLRRAIRGWRAFAEGLGDAGVRVGQDNSDAGCMATANAYASQIESILEGRGL